MTHDVETLLTRELRSVADDLVVPPLPRLDLVAEEAAPVSLLRRWSPLLVAAVLAVLVGATSLWFVRGQDDVQPAPPGPAPSDPTPTGPTETVDPDAPVPTTAPTVTHVVNEELWVAGRQVPGQWWAVSTAADVWLAASGDGTWSYARGDGDPVELDAPGMLQRAVLSPGGDYVAAVVTSGGRSYVWGIRTSGGEFGGVEPATEVQGPEGQSPWVAAVTDAGLVVLRTADGNAVYDAAGGGGVEPVTGDGWTVVDDSAAGPVVTDGADATDAMQGDVRLAEITADGRVETTASLRPYGDLAVSPSATWMAWVEPEYVGGEAMGAPTLEVAAVGGGRPSPDDVSLVPPDGWVFSQQTQVAVWEDDDYFLAGVYDEVGTWALVRCGVQQQKCVLLDTPGAPTS